MVDLDALREALAGLAEKWDEYGGPYPDEAVIVAAARELLTGQDVWWCQEHSVCGDAHLCWPIKVYGGEFPPINPCRMVEAHLTIPGDTHG